ncbi:MAG: hypothetical protein K8R53_03865 [Bacteroidales bacterium]|nr:hypothetical protein [Bacteroidales bacterium]
MDVIGGYFELELNDSGTFYHDDAIRLNSGRNALEYILIQNKFEKVYLPYYYCDVILQPVERQKTPYEFYHLTTDFMPEIDNIETNSALLFINYYGLFDNRIELLQKKFNNIIIDNSQSFFSFPIHSSPTFYSPRKFFGLPDGGMVYTDRKVDFTLERDNSEDRILHLIKRIEQNAESGYVLFKENESRLDFLPVKQMSFITERILKNINFEKAIKKRKDNFIFFHNKFKDSNELTPLIDTAEFIAPLSYPYLNKNNEVLRETLINKNIYVPTFWPNVLNQKANNSFEYHLAKNLIPLPTDQRYETEELASICPIIYKFQKKYRMHF